MRSRPGMPRLSSWRLSLMLDPRLFGPRWREVEEAALIIFNSGVRPSIMQESESFYLLAEIQIDKNVFNASSRYQYLSVSSTSHYRDPASIIS
jgi:hypothetical protein